MIELNLSREIFNDKAYELMGVDKRYIVLYGGAGSGKSYGIVQNLVYRLLTERMNLLVVRNTGVSNRDSTFALFKQVLNRWELVVNKVATVNETDMRIRFINGNAVIFKGLDDTEKLKSVTFDNGENGELTDVWIEEASEVLEADFNQLDVRLRGGKQKKHIYISFNPVNILHWLKKRFVDKPADNVYVQHSTYKDNKFLDDDYRKLLESYKDTDAYYYQVYCLGQFGSINQCFFDARRVQERLYNAPEPLYTCRFDIDRTLRYKRLDGGYIRIYNEPVPGHKYVIGGDTASGAGSDYCVGYVLDNETGKTVAVLHERMDTDLYAKQMYALGHYYNYALIGIESNFDLYPIKWLEENGYTNQYVREQQDTFTGGIKKAFGFRTDSFSRPRILSQLVQIVRDYTYLIDDRQTLEEMLTFVRNEKGRPEAEEGAHDDLVMALAIAFDIRTQVRYDIPIEEEEEKEGISFFDYEG